ncbi:hypothetical protein NIES2100_20570 [Calothrix sp. NIES-2100]|uniref:PEP-CTERM sorting domain-containing protein n=1 Tax=Calothrix sp. NIES-2100 TaxID=1954172 RepID=UPI000B61488D|nr:hypothetical protein NIES2100_20570 [Calothrix sp. NIES-2100]
MKINSFVPALLVTTSVAFAAQVIPAQAFELGFTNRTNNGSINVASQFKTSIDDIGSGKVKFTFNNTGAKDASITEINFGKTDFNKFLSYSSLSNTTGVNFKTDKLANLASLGWTKNDTALTFGVNNGGYQKDGVDTGESLSIIFNLASGKTFSDIENGFKTGTIAIATHVQSIGGSGGYSDKFESTYQATSPSKSVPEPGTILGLMAFGMGGLLTRKNGKKEPVTAKVTV